MAQVDEEHYILAHCKHSQRNDLVSKCNVFLNGVSVEVAVLQILTQQ